METTTVTFDSHGTDCAATLYRDESPGPERPCVVLCAGFSGTQDTPSVIAAATAFAEAGCVAMTFDYRSFGASGGEPRQVADIEGQLADIAAAVAYARAQPGVDAARIVLWGSSLGGGHVVTAAARDPRIAAVIAQVPFNGFPAQAEGRSKAETRALQRAIVTDWLRGLFRRPPRYIAAVGKPGELAVMTGPRAHRIIEAMDSPTWRNSIAPRTLLAMARYKPGDHAPQLRMPLLVCIAENDRETPPEDALELARRAPDNEVRTYSFSHFEIYHPDNRAKVLADQLDFLRRKVLDN